MLSMVKMAELLLAIPLVFFSWLMAQVNSSHQLTWLMAQVNSLAW
jgi:hypothetical protein